MVYTSRIRGNADRRPRAFWGALIPAAINFVGGLITSSQQAKAQKRALEEQQRLAQQQLQVSNQNNLATTLNNYASANNSYSDEDYNLKYRNGGTRRLGSNSITITDGGNARKIGNNTYLLRGGSHEDINETGQTGIGINVGGNEIEAEGGEVAQKKNKSLRIFSAQPMLSGGLSPAQAIIRGYNKDKVFAAQQRFKRNNGIKDDGSKARVGGYYGANYPSPLSLLSILYDKILGRFDDKNPNLQTGIAPTPSRGLNLKQVRSGLVNRNMLPTNRVYRIANMREVKDAKAVGQYRKLPENVTLPTKTVRSKSGRTFTFGKAGGNSHGGKAAAMGEPWTGTTSAGYNESKYVISTPSRHTVWQVGHHGNYSKPLPADAIKKGSGIWKKFDAEGNTGISTKRMVVYKDLGNGRYLRLAKSKYRLGGGLTSKDRGSSKHPYPSVSSKDFAGSCRSYPILTKADAIDALRLAGLHGRSDVRSKVYSKYPELRKKAKFGDWFTSLFNNNTTTSPKKTVHFYKSKSGRVFKNYNEALYDNKLWNNDVVYRYNRKGDLYHKKYGLREHNIPFQKQNAITLRNAGRASGAVISPNQLDSIAKYANRAGLSIPTAFGMVMKESTFNNPTDTKSAAKLFGLKKGTREYNKWVTGQHFQGNGSRLDKGNARDFINFHKDDSLNPYWQDMRYVENQTRDMNKAREMLINGERNADRKAKYAPKLTKGKKLNVMEAAFKDYKTNPYGYNPGQKDYVKLINQNAKDIMNSPQIQQWYKSSPYAKGRKYKCGGRIKAEDGTRISLTSSYSNKDFLHRITQGHPTARKIVNEIFGDEADRRRFIQDLNIFGYGSEDASSIAGASPIFRQPIVSAAKQAQFIQNANKARQAANANKARQAANYSQQQVDYIKELSDRMSATMRNVGEQLGIRVNPNPNNSVRRLYSSNFKPANTNNRITTPRETPINPSNSSIETPINSTTTSVTNTHTYSGKTTKFNTKYRSYRNAGFSPKTSKNLVKANKLGLYGTIGGFGTIGAGTLIGANINKTDKANKTSKAQLDAKGKPISPYIAKPQEPVKPLTGHVDKPVKPLIGQVPDSIARKDTTRRDTTRTDTTKQVNKVVKRQVRTTPQYKGNTTKGNYQLHDGETKVINGIKYTRRGNTIINHKTNVGYIYDKNGNYTGQADYSKVGNFNQAFDAARAAGRSQFIYRAGKYNNYSTAKETNAKKEALNRRIGARRIAKRCGGIEHARRRAALGTQSRYGFTGDGQFYYDKNRASYVDNPYYGMNGTIPEVVVTAPKKTSIDLSTTPYLGRQNTFKPAAQDYIGLGIDTLAALGSGMFTRSAYNKMNFDYALPNYVDESPVAFDTIYHNEAQRANVERNRLNSRNLIRGNTSSAQTALGRMQQTDTDAMMELNKLADEKANKEVELRNQNAANEQQVRARNAAARNQYYQNVAQIKNAALEAKNNAALAKAQSIGADLSGLSQAWTNFASTIENRYDARQNEIAAISSANSPSVVKNAISLGYNLSPEVLANLYKNSKNEELRNTIIGRLSPNERKRYGIK
jgi:hypothetical protein